MFAAYAARFDPGNPLAALELGERPEPEAPPQWTTIDVRAASLNHHDLWTLRGVGLPEESLPMILGCDAAGTDADGNEVVVYPVIGATGHGVGPREQPTILTEKYQGTFAQRLAVPQWNVLPKPAELSFEEAACLSTAWLTAYRMLFTNAGVRPGDSVLVQGAGGGVATAAIVLGAAAGLRVFATSRDESKRRRAEELGAELAVEPGARLPHRVDAVIETVGAATWSHSVKSLRRGGTMVISGATSGTNPPSGELNRIFFLELKVVGSTMGTKEELAALLNFCATKGVRPVIDSVMPLERAREGFGRMASGDLFGKIVFTL
ncbi:zinc-binding dehydrogenase [Streptomyces alkaliphilus]|uniref:Zinc-binding dehydrogenase n=1 Tax=Streptomyces alkaliphilus TaxID=1472722 RepID=A0A7W3TAU2_9ACTN|nr:zinc-binding dehydrogenase [Streptomyces alkaliphilus]MBB0243347.1 zinc-binding dehydrogenase [Streptomyces alkaliphilus]MQS06281.1 zinc-binding dehydrogenase [Streptomyces alkaliphilus]